MKTVFLRVLEAEDKAAALLEAVHDADRVSVGLRFETDPVSFGSVPGSPFAYWVSDSLRSTFSHFPPVESENRHVGQGLGTADDFRFVRLWWEVAPERDAERNWWTFVRGGKTSPFYGDVDSVLSWGTAGAELKAWSTISTGGDHWSRNIRSTELYFKPGLTWPLRAPRFAPYPIPAGSIFSIRGYAFIAPVDVLLPALATFLSSTFDYLFKMMLGRHGHPEFIVGIFQRMPWGITDENRETLSRLARRAWSIKRTLDTSTETSHAFTAPALLQAAGVDVAARAAAWSQHVRTIKDELTAIQAEIDERCFDLYAIDEADRHAITGGFDGSASASGEATEIGLEADADTDNEGDEEIIADPGGLAAELASWAAGVAFGRFDLRLASDVRALPAEPEPFDALPVCSPAMLTGDDGLPVATPPPGYPVAFPENGILVDDPGHARDLTAAVRGVFDEIFGDRADAWWDEAAALLDPNEQEMRAWVGSNFVEYHLKRHSKSRRKAPIVWQLGTPSGRYSAWLYVHRLTRDTFFQLQNDVVAPKLAHEERQLSGLVQSAGGSPSAKERKEIAAQAASVEELRALLDEVKRVTPLWNPMLDDGVVLVMAPLWRLAPQHKTWQKELKGKWDELAGAKYDWAQTAMHLWPERVVPKCVTDRSLAIAHGVEDIFWVEGADGKWKPRPIPTRSVEDLVRERSSSAVKAALKRLLEAAAPSNGTKRTRRGEIDA